MITFKRDMPLKDYDAVSLAEILRIHFVENYPIRDTERLAGAIQVASYLHRHDVRRGARGKSVKPPYIEHPLRVAIRLHKYLGVRDPDILIAAVLHDTVEDHARDFQEFQGTSNNRVNDEASGERLARDYALDFIATHFGRVVAVMVEDVSNPVLDYDMPKAEKVKAYHTHIKDVTARSVAALAIKLSDFVDNAGSLHHHYDYDDKKVTYFLDRYEPLISVYGSRILGYSGSGFDAQAAYARLEAVQQEFAKFREGTK